MRGSDPSDRLFGECIIGSAKHLLGDQIDARRHLEQVLTRYAATDRGWDVTRFGTDLRVSARAYLARVLWLQGFADQAVRTAEMSIAEAQSDGSRTVTVLGPRLGGMSDRAVDGKPGRHVALYTNAARPIQQVWLFRFGVRFVLDFKKLSFSGVAISTRDRSARKRASTRAASRNRVFES